MSKNFDKVKSFYNANLWSEKMVWNTIDRWISVDEFQEFTEENIKSGKREK